ncbi:MAG TPA: cytochrome c peroxidase, partial [Puia sp.]
AGRDGVFYHFTIKLISTMKTLLITGFLILLLLISRAAAWNDRLTGKWESLSVNGNVTSVVFFPDHTFDGYVNDKPFTNGEYTLSDSIFTLVDNGCNGVRGTYRIMFFSNDDSIRLQVIQDSCTERGKGISQLVLGRKKPMDKVGLGKLLFFDPILSQTKTVSCASCHQPEHAFADTTAVSVGIYGRKGVRNTPSAMNLSLQPVFFWDGRAKTLEEQALAPIENQVEMGLPMEQALARLKQEGKYRQYFWEVFKSEPTRAGLGAAIAAYERSLETNNSPFDNWRVSRDSTVVSASVRRGFDVFNKKGKCVNCHFGADFTTHEFRNIGLFDGKALNDSGKEMGKFKVPGLRNVARTAPYMHNGQLRTLKEVIEFYNDPEKVVAGAVNRDSLLAKPLGLTEGEKADLEAFLVALTDRRFTRKR